MLTLSDHLYFFCSLFGVTIVFSRLFITSDADAELAYMNEQAKLAIELRTPGISPAFADRDSALNYLRGMAALELCQALAVLSLTEWLTSACTDGRVHTAAILLDIVDRCVLGVQCVVNNLSQNLGRLFRLLFWKNSYDAL